MSDIPIYCHTQLGKLLVLPFSAATLILLGIVLGTGGNPVLWIMLGISVVLLGQFHSLTVQVDTRQIKWWFGWGLIRKSVPISEIKEAEPVTNRWYYGWGIRWTPHGWLFNVSGWEAVQIRLEDRCFRVGSDEPHRLAAAIRQAQSQAR